MNREGISPGVFASVMATLAAAFPTPPLTKERVAVYFDFLKHVPEGVLKNAVTKIISSRTYPTFPTIGDIRAEVEGTTPELLEAVAATAWAKAQLFILTRERSDPLINEAVKNGFGNWSLFIETDNWNDAARKRFYDAYKNIAKREASHRALSGDQPKAAIPEKAEGGNDDRRR